MTRRPVFVGATVLLGMAAPALGAGPWSAPRLLVRSPNFLQESHLSVASDGRAAATWRSGAGTRVAVRATPTGAFAGARSFPGAGTAYGPPVNIDAQGTVRMLPAGGTIALVQGTATTPFSTVSLANTTQVPSDPALAVDPGGAMALGWVDLDGGVVLRTQPAGAPLGGPVTVAAQPELLADAVDPAGDAAAVWTDITGAQPAVVALVVPAGGAAPVATQLSTAGTSATDPHVGMDAAGDALALWSGFTGGRFAVFAARRPAGGDWGAPRRLSSPASDAGQPALAVTSSGRAVAAWTADLRGRLVVQAATVDLAGGDWSTPVTISRGRLDADRPAVVMAASGAALAAWRVADLSGGLTPTAAARTAAGVWSAPAAVAPASQVVRDLALGTDAAGRVSALWVARSRKVVKGHRDLQLLTAVRTPLP